VSEGSSDGDARRAIVVTRSGVMSQAPLDPAAALSVVRVRVRFGETDLMGIVHHASYVHYMEVARIEWLRRRGVAYADWAAHGVHLPVVDLSLQYRAPARFDDEIDVHVSLVEVGAASVRFEYRLLRVSDGTLCTAGMTRLACIDSQLALRRISPEIAEFLNQPERPT
jgi:acyl-CoA thioester hydrolase